MIIKKFKSIEELKKEVSDTSFEYKYPFSEICYFETFCKHFGEISNFYIFGFFDETQIVACSFFEKIDNEKVVFLGMKPVLGDEEVTDFGEVIWNSEISSQKSVVKEVWESIFDFFKNEGVKILQLDYLREDSESYKFFSQNKIGEIEKSYLFKISWDRQETSPFIDLSGVNNWEEYLMSLDRKKRKEIKRKIKRLEEKEFKYEILAQIDEKDFEDFVRLHRLSDSNKEKFMNEKMKSFFYDIVFCNRSDWKIKLAFLEIDKKRVASLFYFEKNSQILLYNSGFDPEYGFYSVGVMLIAYVLREAIKNKIIIYDFLRGNERYKYDLGAKDLWLYKIVVNLKYV